MMIAVAIIIFLAIFTQALTGFGLAMVSMPLLVMVLDIKVATPLVALVAIIAEPLLLFYYRASLQFRSLGRLIVASLVGVPFGVLALGQVDEDIVLTVLGIVLAAYAIYALFQFRLPTIAHPWWAYGFGFMAGLLGGAYNVAGPPVIVYGNCRRWEPRTFKGNLQGFFVVVSSMVAVTHGVSGNYTREVWENLLVALPAIGLGLVGGFYMDRFLNPDRFRKLVLVLLVILGVQMVLNAAG